MKRYRKKPVVVEAWCWDETRTMLDALVGAGMAWTSYNGWAAGHKDHNTITRLKIATREGAMYADLGDYIIKGVRGEFYPCKPDIFEATYTLAEEAEVDTALQELLEASREALKAPFPGESQRKAFSRLMQALEPWEGK